MFVYCTFVLWFCSFFTSFINVSPWEMKQKPEKLHKVDGWWSPIPLTAFEIQWDLQLHSTRNSQQPGGAKSKEICEKLKNREWNYDKLKDRNCCSGLDYSCFPLFVIRLITIHFPELWGAVGTQTQHRLPGMYLNSWKYNFLEMLMVNDSWVFHRTWKILVQ